MALSGLHVAHCYGGSFGAKDNEIPLVGQLVWSQTMASAATTTQAAREPAPTDAGQAIFRVISSADAWVSIGSNPDATSGARYYVQALTEYDFAVMASDKLAWVLA